VFSHRHYLKDRYSVDLRYTGVLKSKTGMFDRQGLSEEAFSAFDTYAKTYALEQMLQEVEGTPILVDTTSSDETVSAILAVLKQGGYIVLSNKKPLTGAYALFNTLIHEYPGKVYYETTVGGALPVISTLQTLLETGDRIHSIEGVLSGTLSFVCSEIDRGSRYSEAIEEARVRGFTEPDPRDDLSGNDVARKALILARMLGREIEMKDIPVIPFFDESLRSVNVEQFMEMLSKHDDHYTIKFKRAKEQNHTLRYVAAVSMDTVSVSLKEVPAISPLGQLTGPDNKIMFTSDRYQTSPLVVSGPGAGMGVTAGGVFGDILRIVRR
jgi:homoserine dehydrogenase